MASSIVMRESVLKTVPHLEVASGDIASFQTDMVAPLKELKVHFYCQQSGSGTPSPTNIRPLSGWSGLDIYDNQKNLLEITPETAIIFSSAYGNCTVNGDGSITLYGAAWVMFPVPVKPNTTYTYSGVTSKKTNDLLWRILGGYTEKPTAIAAPYNWVVNNGARNWSSATFTTDADTKWILVGVYCDAQYVSDGNQTISNMQIELGSTATDYEPYNGTKNSVLFPSEAGTVYGGYIDAVRGKLVAEFYHATVDGSELSTAWTISGGNKYRAQIARWRIIPDRYRPECVTTTEVDANITCNCLPSAAANSIWSGTPGIALQDNQFSIGWGEPDLTVETVQAKLQAQPVHFTYKLLNPIEYDIDPITLKTLRGVNNIWSNANGNVEATYWTH